MIRNFYYWNRSNLFRKGMALLFVAFLFTGFLYSQGTTVTGTIVDRSGEALPGASIVIKGTANGVISDMNGNFTIAVPDKNSVLQITFVGYESQEITVGEQTHINVTLEVDVRELNEVVVTGYGTQKKSDLTGSIASVSGKSLTQVPVTGLDQAMQGMAAGVNIIPVTGRPGSAANIQIRGIASINGTNPLIILDGVSQGTDPGVLSGINPNDVESIEVLKDASSAAIYGASGGNGVILITTKKGQSGKLKVNYNSYFGEEKVIKELDLMNTRQWVELIDETTTAKTVTISTSQITEKC